MMGVMDLRRLLAIVGVVAAVFGFGLTAFRGDVLYASAFAGMGVVAVLALVLSNDD